MYKVFILLFFVLSSCYKFKESNDLAIPPIARDEIEVIAKTK
jgi:hypothetical protein